MIVKTTVYALKVTLNETEGGLLRTLFQQARNAQLQVQLQVGVLEVQGPLRDLTRFMERYADVLEVGHVQLQPEVQGCLKVKPG